MPAEWGGAGLTIFEQAVVQEELGRLTGALWDMVWRPANALRFCTPEQREHYLIPVLRGERRDCRGDPEAEAGSDPQPDTTATQTDGGWLINGEKWFVTVGDHADFLSCWPPPAPAVAPTLFLIDKDTPGIAVTSGRRASCTPSSTSTRSSRSPTCSSGRQPCSAGSARGYDITRGWFTEERLMIAARTIGAAERALRWPDWAREREQFGQRRSTAS